MNIWPMRPLLQDDQGNTIESTEQWERHAQTIRDRLIATLGTKPASQKLRHFEVGEPEVDGPVTRSLVRIHVDDDDCMDAWLLGPSEVEPNGGAVLVLHQTHPEGKDEVAGYSKKPKLPKRPPYARELAERGWYVLAPDQFALSNRYARGLDAYDTARFYERFPEWSGVGKTIFDAQVALDVMEQLPQTQGLPVSLIGHSLGAHSVLFLAAMDDRPQAVVSNCGLYPFADSSQRAHFFRDQWYIYFKDARLKQSVLDGPMPYWDFHEIAALTAPRRLLLLNAPNDDLVQSTTGLMQATEQLHQVYEMLEAKRALTCVLHNEGHTFERWHVEFAYHWLEAGL